jgi:hypothetical protein
MSELQAKFEAWHLETHPPDEWQIDGELPVNEFDYDTLSRD